MKLIRNMRCIYLYLLLYIMLAWFFFNVINMNYFCCSCLYLIQLPSVVLSISYRLMNLHRILRPDAIIVLALILVSRCISMELKCNILVLHSHKTGTVLMMGVLKQLAPTFFDKKVFSLPDPLEKVPTKDVLTKVNEFEIYIVKFCFFLMYYKRFHNYKALIIFRNPLDLAISSARYHKIAKEGWLYKKKPELNGTYQSFIKSLDNHEAMIFEMTCGTAISTIHDMILLKKWTQKQLNEANTSVHKIMYLEDFKRNFNESIGQVADYFGVSRTLLLRRTQQLSYDKFTMQSNHSSIVNRSHAVFLASQHRYEFSTSMSCLAYNTFENVYGTATLQHLGYGDALEVFQKGKVDACANITLAGATYVGRNCTCPSLSELQHKFIGCVRKVNKYDLRFLTGQQLSRRTDVSW